MKAAYIESVGGPENIRIGDLTTPTPQLGEVLVKVAAASVNPVDTYIRAGKVAMNLPTPFIVGCDVAGTVTALGEGVQRYKVGDRVWGSNQGLVGRQGTFAEFAAVHEDWLYPLPDGVKEADAAALALVGITAHLGLFWRTQLRPYETVFVNGGSGGVGLCVVQMAKATGAKVIATAGHPEKIQSLKNLGTDLVLNYKTDNIIDAVKDFTKCQGVNVHFDTVPPTDFDKSVELMAQRGRMVVMAGRAARPVFPNGPFYVKALSLTGFVMFSMSPEEQRVCADDMNKWMVSGQLKAFIGKTFSLDEAVEAHKLQEANTTGGAGTLLGKIVVGM